jgi:hypothetical protein
MPSMVLWGLSTGGTGSLWVHSGLPCGSAAVVAVSKVKVAVSKHTKVTAAATSTACALPTRYADSSAVSTPYGSNQELSDEQTLPTSLSGLVVVSLSS